MITLSLLFLFDPTFLAHTMPSRNKLLIPPFRLIDQRHNFVVSRNVVCLSQHKQGCLCESGRSHQLVQHFLTWMAPQLPWLVWLGVQLLLPLVVSSILNLGLQLGAVYGVICTFWSVWLGWLYALFGKQTHISPKIPFLWSWYETLHQISIKHAIPLFFFGIKHYTFIHNAIMTF